MISRQTFNWRRHDLHLPCKERFWLLFLFEKLKMASYDRALQSNLNLLATIFTTSDAHFKKRKRHPRPNHNPTQLSQLSDGLSNLLFKQSHSTRQFRIGPSREKSKNHWCHWIQCNDQEISCQTPIGHHTKPSIHYQQPQQLAKPQIIIIWSHFPFRRQIDSNPIKHRPDTIQNNTIPPGVNEMFSSSKIQRESQCSGWKYQKCPKISDKYTQ